MSQLAKKVDILFFYLDLGWEVKLVHPFYSFHWLRGHKKHLNNTLNHDSTQNRWHDIEFSSFFVIFDQKMTAILNVDKFFKKNSKEYVRSQRGHCVKIWRSYVKRPSRYGFILKQTNTQTNKPTKLVKLIDS